MESNSCRKICRFCLKTSDSNFETIEKLTFANLDCLWLKLNLSISEGPVVCGACSKTIRTSSDFKTKYVGIENCIVLSVKDKDSIEIDSREGYASKMVIESRVNVPEDHTVCRLCLELVQNDSAIFLRNAIDVQELEQYFSELDLSCTEDPIICASCQISLQSYFNFINTCLATEEKIIEYCKVEGTNGKGQIDLNTVIDFVSKDFLKCKFEIEAFKIGETCNEDSENSYDGKIKQEILDMELDIKEESSVQESGLTDENCFQHRPSTSQSDHVPQPTTGKIEMQSTIHKCTCCNYETKWETNFKRHMLTHKTPPETIMYKCEVCAYETEHKRYLQQHRLIHMDLSEAEMQQCPFETKWKKHLRLSLRKIPNVVKPITVYKIDLCDYEAKQKDVLTKHMLIHKTPLETTMYKCDLCNYKTKQKSDLSKHILLHKSHSYVYKCDLCDYETKQKSDFSKHIVLHESHLYVYKCDLCDYETKRKRGLNKHMLVHKAASEITMYKCDLCDYETKRKFSLKRHIMTHSKKKEKRQA